ncbi:hypothetical protein LguiA_007942 [Lonicera macranthoides]
MIDLEMEENNKNINSNRDDGIDIMSRFSSLDLRPKIFMKKKKKKKPFLEE